jgi:hypothetical protein
MAFKDVQIEEGQQKPDAEKAKRKCEERKQRRKEEAKACATKVATQMVIAQSFKGAVSTELLAEMMEEAGTGEFQIKNDEELANQARKLWATRHFFQSSVKRKRLLASKRNRL